MAWGEPAPGRRVHGEDVGPKPTGGNSSSIGGEGNRSYNRPSTADQGRPNSAPDRMPPGRQGGRERSRSRDRYNRGGAGGGGGGAASGGGHWGGSGGSNYTEPRGAGGGGDRGAGGGYETRGYAERGPGGGGGGGGRGDSGGWDSGKWGDRRGVGSRDEGVWDRNAPARGGSSQRSPPRERPWDRRDEDNQSSRRGGWDQSKDGGGGGRRSGWDKETGTGGGGRGGATSFMNVTTKSGGTNLIVKRLLGKYKAKEKGSNHGRKVYCKEKGRGSQAQEEVLLYYWDARDGQEYSGWWFGAEVGGTEVWALASTTSQSPPKVGWKVPWDDKTITPGMLLVDEQSEEPWEEESSSRPSTRPSTTGSGRQSGWDKGSDRQSGWDKDKGPRQPAGAAPGGRSGAVGAKPIDKDQGYWADKLKFVNERVTAGEKDVGATLISVKQTMLSGNFKQAVDALTKLQERLGKTQDVMAAHAKEGQASNGPGQSVVSAVTRLTPKLRALRASLDVELKRVQAPEHKAAALEKAQKSAKEMAEKKKEAEAQRLVDAKDGLPACKVKLDEGEEAVAAVKREAEPILQRPPDPASEEASAIVKKVDALAKTAQEKLQAAMVDISKKVTAMGSGNDTVAIRAEYSALMKKLQPLQLSLNPLKNFKVSLELKIAARRTLEEVAEKIGEIRAESKLAAAKIEGKEQMGEEDVKQAEAALAPVLKIARQLHAALSLQARQAPPTVKDDLAKACSDVTTAKDIAEALGRSLAKQRKGVDFDKGMEGVENKVKAAEEAAAELEQAEEAFTPKAEALEGEQHSEALSSCEKAMKNADTAISQARQALQKKLSEAKMLPDGSMEAMVLRITSWQETIDGLAKKVAASLEASFEQKYGPSLGPAYATLLAAEEKAKMFAEKAQLFGKEDGLVDGLEKKPLDAIRVVKETALKAEKDAQTSMMEARKAMTERAKTPGKVTAGFAAAMAQMTGRLNLVQQEVAKQMRLCQPADKALKSMEVMQDARDKVNSIEEGLCRVEAILETEEKLSSEDATDLVKVTETAQKNLKDVTIEAMKSIKDMPDECKEELKGLVETAKKQKKRVDEVLDKTKEDRARVLAEMSALQAEEMAVKAEEAMDNAEESEVPFLSGLEELPPDEGFETLEKCKTAGAEVELALAKAREFVRIKGFEAKAAKEEVAKPLNAALEKVTERLDAVKKKQVQFKEDTNKRLKAQQLADTRGAIDEAIEKIAEYVEAVKPLAAQQVPVDEKAEDEAKAAADKDKEGDQIANLSAAEATNLRQKLVELELVVKSRMDKAKALLKQLASTSAAERKDDIVKFRERMQQADSDLSEARKSAKGFEEVFQAKRINEQAEKLENKSVEEVANLAEAAKPLLEGGSERFLVAAQVQIVGEVLKGFMKDQDMTTEELFQKAGVKTAAGGISKEGFSAFLAGLAIELQRDDVSFSQERCGVLFDVIASDASLGIYLEDLQKIMVQHMTCAAKVAMTDGLSIGSSKNLAKLDPGAELEVTGVPVKDAPTGMLRVECKLVSGKDAGTVGWVSMKGNQGTTFLQITTPFTKFSLELDEKTKAAENSLTESLRLLKTMISAVPQSATGKLKEAKAKLTTSLQKVNAAANELNALKQKANKAKVDFFRQLDAGRQGKAKAARKKEDAKDGKAPNLDFNESRPYFLCVEEFCGLQSTLETAGSSMLRKVRKDEIIEVLEEPKEEVKEAALRAKVKALKDDVEGYLTIRDDEGTTFAKLGTFHVCTATVAMTNDLSMKKGKIVRKLGSGEVVQVLEGPVKDEGSTLVRIRGRAMKDGKEGWITPKGNAGSLFTRESTSHYLVAHAAGAPLQKAAGGGETLRELEEGEAVEVLEKPAEEAKHESHWRVRCRALGDGVEGYFTFRQGLLRPCTKSYLVLRVAPLRESKEADSTEIRSLQVGETLELLEGPLEGSDGRLWIKAKAPEDGKTGWVPIHDDKGILMQP